MVLNESGFYFPEGVLKVLQGSILNLDFEGIMMTLQALPEQVYIERWTF